ncbi:MAG TPA: hypothetical protein PKY29_01990 [Ferruginibacter sp.]|nr:hypothetical protein [Ferruginibacter sp.]HRN78984.1 hypothetical protein [Ferruginibacter sp.]HRQ20051.1 hypothetical protein [Ferruginibacter sp.]
MKVLCIDAQLPEMPELISTDLHIKENTVYTVVNVTDILDKSYYGLKEVGQYGKRCKYRSDRFIPLSDICEIQQYVQRNKEKNV